MHFIASSDSNDAQQRQHVDDNEQPFDICFCHEEYNHCVAMNPSGIIAEIDPNKPLDAFDPNAELNRAESAARSKPTTTTQTPEVVQAMGFDVSTTYFNCFHFVRIRIRKTKCRCRHKRKKI
jgi:hypothetical protein